MSGSGNGNGNGNGNEPSQSSLYDGTEIAVVGMAGRFPGAPDLDRFWENLAGGVESVRFFTDDELREAGVSESLLSNPDYVRARPVLEDVDGFDAEFFGFAPKEAEVLDPQHRIFLELAWQALESAGYDPERQPGVTSIFAGASFSNYLVHNLYENRPVMESFGDMETTIHNVSDSLPTMLGYKLDLRGACCAVSTFCSTSLVSVHLAVQNLLSFESDLSLAGGVTVNVPQSSGYLYTEGSILSPDGHCRTFDAKARGTVFGNGAGVIVLKRLEDALRDRDNLLAILRGSAVNNDGSTKLSFAAPGMKGQTDVIVEALSASRVDPETIGLVEAHGTGTALGDPVEVKALTRAFRRSTEERAFCALGSVKTNLGHLDAAAGVAGLIKAILALRHRRIPPSLHFEEPNPEMDLESSPFYVPTSLREWPRPEGAPRRAAVSAFGIGGTNAHVILEEAPEASSEPSARPQLIVVSAKTESALSTAARNLAARLRRLPDEALADAAFTLQLGRTHFTHRLALCCTGTLEAARALESTQVSDPAARRGAPSLESPPVTLVVRGEGMSDAAVRELARHAPVFRREIEHAGAVLLEGPARVLAIEHALARQYLAWGVRPRSFVGDGVGALVARVLGGELELAQALRAPDADASAPSRPVDEATGLVLEVGGAATSYPSMLASLGRLWLAGVPIDWTRLHDEERRRRIELPTYPFERKRYWVEPAVDPETQVLKRDDVATWFYHPQWRSSLAAPPSPDERPSRHLIVADHAGVAAAVAQALRARGRDVRLHTAEVAGPELVEEYRSLLRETGAEGVLDFTSLDGGRRGFDSALALVQALDSRRRVSLKLVTAGAHDVSGLERLSPEAAMVPALARVAAQESEHLVFSNVDIEDPSTSRPVIDRLVEELDADSRAPVVAFRGGRRWLPFYETIPLGDSESTPAVLRPSGVYWITGGLGQVGYMIALYLAKKVGARLVLSGRTGLPPREAWNRHLSGPTGDRIRKVLALEELGAEVLVLSADVSSESEMRRALGSALERFGGIQGVVHAAGDLTQSSFVLVDHLDHAACERQFAPKIRGLQVLDELFRGQPLDFWFLTSSLSVVLGGLGYAAYAAANAFLDVYAAKRNREDGGTGVGPPWKVVDWDQWSFDAAASRSKTSLESLAMTPAEGLSTFGQVLRMEVPSRVVISTAPLVARMERWVTTSSAASTAPKGAGESSSSSGPSHARPSLSTEYVAPRNEVESKLARIFEELLGVDRVGVKDDFFSLGGHSLFAARLLSRLKDAFSVSLPIATVFDRPTVEALAERVQAVQWLAKGNEASSREPSDDRVEVEL